MHNIFKLEDLLNVLIVLETTGSSSYKKMANNTDDKEIEELFTTLANQEENHKLIYTNYKKSFVTFESSEVSIEYSEYIYNLLFNITEFLKVDDIEDLKKAFEFSIQLEKETIMLLNELRDLMPESERENINMLIKEERSHIVFIGKMRKKKIFS